MKEVEKLEWIEQTGVTTTETSSSCHNATSDSIYCVHSGEMVWQICEMRSLVHKVVNHGYMGRDGHDKKH